MGMQREFLLQSKYFGKTLWYVYFLRLTVDEKRRLNKKTGAVHVPEVHTSKGKIWQTFVM